MRGGAKSHKLSGTGLPVLVLLLALLLGGNASAGANTVASAENTQAAAPPPTIASLNVCTDQLAMLLAAPGQLLSVSSLARDPTLSHLHLQAALYPANRGLAEEVFAIRPDLVVTGTFSLHNTAQLLQRLGFRIEEFDYAQSVETIPGDIRRMGRLLGQTDRAEAMAGEFERGIDNLPPLACSRPPIAIAYDQNSIALGSGTLADSIIQTAGFKNFAADRGYVGMQPFPLELLVENPPDLIILPQQMGGTPSLADQIIFHPALARLGNALKGSYVESGLWSCGGPFTLAAIRELRALAANLAPCQAGRTP